MRALCADGAGKYRPTPATSSHSGHLRQEDPARVAAIMWTAMHGYVMLELAGLSPQVE